MKKNRALIDTDKQLAACECRHAKLVNRSRSDSGWHVECGNSARPLRYTDPMFCALCEYREPA